MPPLAALRTAASDARAYVRSALAVWERLDSVLGLGIGRQALVNVGTAASLPASDESAIGPELLALLDERQAARKAKDFKRADAIRDELKAKGWVIEDTPKGPRLKRL